MSGLVRMPNQATLLTSSPKAAFSEEETISEATDSESRQGFINIPAYKVILPTAFLNSGLFLGDGRCNLFTAKAMSGLVRMPNQATLLTSSPKAAFSAPSCYAI
jgi:hypothetical protein